jgi:hypothetical protein
MWVVGLLTKFICLTKLGVQFLNIVVWYLRVFSTNISIHSVIIIGNSPKKISCSSLYTYLCIHFLSLIQGFFFLLLRKFSFLPFQPFLDLFLSRPPNIPLITNSGSQQHNHLLVLCVVYKTLGSIYLWPSIPTRYWLFQNHLLA